MVLADDSAFNGIAAEKTNLIAHQVFIMKHEYTPEEALRRLIEKLTRRDQELAAEVTIAVNSGKDIQETERRGKKTLRFYRRRVSYSPDEALKVALDVLSAHFVEQPLFMNSCHDNMAKAAIGANDPSSFPWEKDKQIVHSSIDEEKAVEIEVQTETEIVSTGDLLALKSPETLRMIRMSQDDIKQEEANLNHLRTLTNFAENS